MSQPVKTPFGYHLIQVEEKKATGPSKNCAPSWKDSAPGSGQKVVDL